MTLLDCLDDAAAHPTSFTFLPSGDQVDFGSLWRTAARATAWFAHPEHWSVGIVLESTPECWVAILGAFRAGVRLVSLPLPPRGGSLDDYEHLIRRVCALAGIGALLVDNSYVALIPDIGIPVQAFEACTTSPSRVAADSAGGEFIQFTSGSSAEPKGVCLSLDHLHANVAAILAVVNPQPGDAAVSWLPLSHDMGFVGMGLSAICAAGSHTRGGDIVFIRPDAFIRRPELWLQTCSQFNATFTAAPDFGFQLAMRRGHSALDELDLSALRVCITGAEPVRADTLRTFADSLSASGFDPTAFCPAYGLAEATLAVTMTRPTDRWRSVKVDGEQLRAGNLVVDSGGDSELVAAGPPLPGYRVSPATGALGRIEVAGPSVFNGYLGGKTHVPAGVFTTQDEGFQHDGQLYVTGRLDDVVLIAGRNVSLPELERSIASTGVARSGNVAVVASGASYVIVAEATEQARPHLAATIRSAAVRFAGVGPSEILLVRRGTLPKTSSGKPRRWEVAKRVREDMLEIEHRSAYR